MHARSSGHSHSVTVEFSDSRKLVGVRRFSSRLRFKQILGSLFVPSRFRIDIDRVEAADADAIQLLECMVDYIVEGTKKGL